MRTRGSFSGSGLRPVGFARSCFSTVVEGVGIFSSVGAGTSIETTSIVSCSDVGTCRSRFCPTRPASSFRYASIIET